MAEEDKMFLGYYPGIPFKTPIIRFYAIFILAGGLLALFLSNYHAKKDGFRGWDFFNSVFLVAFPMGIVGARIWYVIATWPTCAPTAGRWYAPFAIWEGGLAIQGGALLGVISGVLYAIFRRRGTSILKIRDWAVPTILVAQRLGRWGNFFNQEVFGHSVSPLAWDFLPSFITNNRQNGNLPRGKYYYGEEVLGSASVSQVLPQGSLAAPLFLVEGRRNLLGYFLLQYGLNALEGKRYVDGDKSFAYFIIYGIVRIVLEPLRNPQFIRSRNDSGAAVGTNHSSYQSFVRAGIYIGVGLLLIVLNHLFRHRAKKGRLDSFKWFKSCYIEEDAQLVREVGKKERDSLTKNEESPDRDLSLLKKKEEELSAGKNGGKEKNSNEHR